MDFPNFAFDNDLTNSRPTGQLRVDQKAILDEEEDNDRAFPKDDAHFAVPYTKEPTRPIRGCVSGEVALKKRRTGRAVKEHSIYNTPSDPKLPAGVTPHFSHLNHLAVPMPKTEFDKLSKDEKRCVIEQQFQVAGIVATTAEPEYEGKQLGKNLFVVDIGGVRSIFNNNPTKTILQGQLVMARAPDHLDLPRAPTGTDPDKVLAVLEPFDPNDVVTRDTIEHFLRIDNPANPPTVDEETAFAAKFITYPAGTGMKLPQAKTHPVHFMRAVVAFMQLVKNGVEQAQATAATAAGAVAPVIVPVPLTLAEVRSMLLDKGTVNDVTMDLMNSYHVVNHHVQSQVLGVALSDGPPNSRFDIKVGSYAT